MSSVAVREVQLSDVKLELLEPLVGQEFLLYPPTDWPGWSGHPARLTLLRVQRQAAARPGCDRDPFSAIFAGPGGPHTLPGCLHALHHHDFRINDLFISRVSTGRAPAEEMESGRYEAIFA
jgi:hypothetical protein